MANTRFATGCALLASVALTYPDAHAGWTGQMNGAAFGRSSVNVTSATGLGKSAANPTTVQFPSAAMIPTGGYLAGADLPSGASPSTTARIKGNFGYVWQANTYASGGDRTDNATIESLFNITPQLFAELDINTSTATLPGGGIRLYVNGVATGGTALLLRGFFWEGDESIGPSDDFIARLTREDYELWEPIIGQGVNDPTVSDDGSIIETYYDLPNVNPQNWSRFYIITDGYATSAVPESGAYMGLAFALSFAGMAALHRVKRAPQAS